MPSEQQQREIEAIWQREKKSRGPLLYEGLILNAVRYDENGLDGTWISYQIALAAYRSDVLARALNVQVVSVSGLTVSREHLLLGKRALYVAQNPGSLELVPSGGIDPTAQMGDQIDYRGAILQEFEEETGLSRSKVEQITPLALVSQENSRALEICLRLELSLEACSIPLHSEEYQELFWVKLSCAEEWLSGAHGEVVPLSQEIFKRIALE